MAEEKQEGFFDLKQLCSEEATVNLKFYNFDNGILKEDKKTTNQIFSYSDDSVGEELKAISYSFGTPFFADIIQKFNKSIILCGNEKILADGLLKASQMQLLQKDMIKLLAKNDSEKVILNYVKSKKLELYIPKEVVFHNKIYLMNFDNEHYRIYTGSANMSDMAHSLKQGEIRLYSDLKENYDKLSEDFEEIKDKYFQLLEPELIEVVHKNNDYLEEHPDEIPFDKKVRKEKVVYFDRTKIKNNNIVYDLNEIEKLEKEREEISKKLPKLKEHNHQIIYTDEAMSNANAVIKSYHLNQIEKEEQREFPDMIIDYQNNKIYLNNVMYDDEIEDEDIRNCFECLKQFCDGIENYTTDKDKEKIKNAEKSMFKFLIWSFLAPFLPKIRYIGKLCIKGKVITNYPKIGFIMGSGVNGKTSIMRLISKFLLGKIATPIKKENFKKKYFDIQKLKNTSSPLFFDDITMTLDRTTFEKMIKDDEYGVDCEVNGCNYPSIIFTSNQESDISKDQILRRTFNICTQCKKIDENKAMEDGYEIDEIINDYGNIGLFSKISYDYIFPAIQSFIDKIKKEEKITPNDYDFYKICSEGICNEYKRVYNTDLLPDYMKTYTYNELRKLDNVNENTKDLLLTWLKVNPDYFELINKGSESFIKISDNMNNAKIKEIGRKLPANFEIKEDIDGFIIKQEIFEEFLNVKFSKGLFGKIKITFTTA